MHVFKDHVLVDYDIYETMMENEAFKEFVTRCVIDFRNHQISKRRNIEAIDETYPIPEKFTDEILAFGITLEQMEGENDILIKYDKNW